MSGPAIGSRVRLPLRQLVGLAHERFLALIRPASGEPSPVWGGGTVGEWARLAGMTGSAPHQLIHDRHAEPLDCGDHDPENVAHIALQQLTARARTERRGGLPFSYRPIRRT